MCQRTQVFYRTLFLSFFSAVCSSPSFLSTQRKGRGFFRTNPDAGNVGSFLCTMLHAQQQKKVKDVLKQIKVSFPQVPVVSDFQRYQCSPRKLVRFNIQLLLIRHGNYSYYFYFKKVCFPAGSLCVQHTVSSPVMPEGTRRCQGVHLLSACISPPSGPAAPSLHPSQLLKQLVLFYVWTRSDQKV